MTYHEQNEALNMLMVKPPAPPEFPVKQKYKFKYLHGYIVEGINRINGRKIYLRVELR